MHLAERVKKNTGVNWDQDQAGCATESMVSLHCTRENKRGAA
jgi:hypothetical protein